MMVHQKWEESEMAEGQVIYTETVLTKELRHNLEFLLDGLKDKCREVLNLWAYSYSMSEIAQMLAYSSPQVVMNKKNLCLKELRKILADNPKVAELFD